MNRYEVTVTLRTGESPIEVVWCSTPTEALELACNRWGKLAYRGVIECEGDE